MLGFDGGFTGYYGEGVMEKLLQAVRESVVEIPSIDGERKAHLERLSAVLGRQVVDFQAHDWVKARQDEGWLWVVEARKFVPRFKYHAGINNTFVTCSVRPAENNGIVFVGNLSVQYAGDMPESVLAKFEHAWDSGCFSGFTIHSNEPLPVEVVELQRVDPVIVGWHFSPAIRTDDRGTNLDTEQFVNNPVGVVIAAWDLDKELL